jgi:hypothetical protein
MQAYTLVAEGDARSHTNSLRPHILVAYGLIHEDLKAVYSSSSRPHALVA